jgi:hypothetical protein
MQATPLPTSRCGDLAPSAALSTSGQAAASVLTSWDVVQSLRASAGVHSQWVWDLPFTSLEQDFQAVGHQILLVVAG